MAIPWLSALKVIPWGDVISHAPSVLEKARDLMARKPAEVPPHSMATPNVHDEVPSFGELKNRLLDASLQIEGLQQRQAELAQTVRELAEQGMLTGASGRNWEAYGGEISLSTECNAIDQALLSDPQTSGGLLVACAPESVAEVLAVFHQHGFADACEVGEIMAAAANGTKLTIR